MSYRGKDKKVDLLPIYNDGGTVEKKVKSSTQINLKFLKLRFSLEDLPILVSIAISWVLVVHFIERLHVRLVLNRCGWKKWEPWSKNSDIHRVALVADPQLVDDYSYPDRPNILNNIIKKISDNYLHRNYRFVQHLLDPDTTMFLGDLFDGGRYWEDKAWLEEYDRFNRIFPKHPDRRTIQSLPGNHDIGFEDINPDKLKKFAAFFGPNNDFLEIGNHSIVLLDSISLSSEDENIRKPAEEFLESVNNYLTPGYPHILLTHVPLYRINSQQLCGPQRESTKLFPVQKGKQYQTVISSDLTTKVLNTIKPTLIFSGDDHDYCKITHDIESGSSATEITVKSAAMTAGIKYPAIQLLSLHNPVDSKGLSLSLDPTYKTEMCYLPDPYFGIGIYVAWLIFCILLLALHFIIPQVEAKILLKLKPNSVLPVFTSQTPLTNRRNIKGFIVSSVMTVMIAYIIIGFYYINV